MSMTYTWAVKDMQVKDQTNSDGDTLKDAVVQTHWKKTGKDSDGNEGTFDGATPFTAENTPKGSFKALADLKESDVLGWIQAQVVGDYEVHVNAQIQKKIDDKAMTSLGTAESTDKSADKLPWAS